MNYDSCNSFEGFIGKNYEGNLPLIYRFLGCILSLYIGFVCHLRNIAAINLYKMERGYPLTESISTSTMV